MTRSFLIEKVRIIFEDWLGYTKDYYQEKNKRFQDVIGPQKLLPPKVMWIRKHSYGSFGDRNTEFIDKVSTSGNAFRSKHWSFWEKIAETQPYRRKPLIL